MPVANSDLEGSNSTPEHITELPFPPLTQSHVLNCSYHSWYPRYRSLTPKARLIPLSPPFLSYLRADGILLPPENPSPVILTDPLTPPPSDQDISNSEDDPFDDPSLAWPEIHSKIKSTITELGGSVMPKLNWSAPKDAAWISATNSMECRTANDVYLLLKSSDFVTHDLEQVFDGCEGDESDSEDAGSWGGTNASEDEEEEEEPVNYREWEKKAKEKQMATIPYHLILRKTIPAYNPALEFRCFVRGRRLLCLCQRDLNHYSFLPGLVPTLRPLIAVFFEKHLRDTFPDENFVFDVYIPPPHKRVWLIDMNPWAIRTDPLLFSWLEILHKPGADTTTSNPNPNAAGDPTGSLTTNTTNKEDDTASDTEDPSLTPEFRLINRDDPEAYSFNTPRYSAHKLPKDVVDAGNEGEAGLREFMGTWREVVRRQEAEDGGDGGEGGL